MSTPLQSLVFGDDQRRVDADDARIGHGDEAALERLVEEGAGDGLVERRLGLAIGDHVDADHQAPPRTSPMKRYLSCRRLSASSITAPTRAEFSTSFSSRMASTAPRPGGGGQRIAAVAGRAPARLAERLGGHALKGRSDPAQREAAADALADRHDVGLEAELVGGPHRSGAAETGQDFVDDQKRAGLRRRFRAPRE